MKIQFGDIPDEKNRDFYILLQRILENVDSEQDRASIAIAGDKCTGKTALSKNIVRFLGESNAVAVNLDDYMMSRQERAEKKNNGFLSRSI